MAVLYPILISMRYASTHVKREAGFTLPELLVVIALLVIIVGLSVLWLRPKDYDPEVHNAQRWANLAQLAGGLKAYAAANGKMPDSITAKSQVIGSETDSGAIDLCRDLVPKYMKTMPMDPSGLDTSKGCTTKDASYVTGYAVVKYIDGSVVLNAFLAEKEELITLRVSVPQ